MNEGIDPFELMNDDRPLLERYTRFLAEVEELGYQVESIHHGALNEHALSAALRIPAQIVQMYFDLYLCEQDEREFLAEKDLDTGLLKILMMLPPRIRGVVYENIDRFLENEFPVKRIVNYVDEAKYRMSIWELFESVDRDYWAAVSGYLKDTNTTSGTITKQFRSVLMKLKMYGPTEGMLHWLERAIIHDFENELEIFTAEPVAKEYEEAVQQVRRFYAQYAYFENSENV